MGMKFFKYFLVIALLAGVVGGCTWLVSKWLVINESIPDTAMKVWGTVKSL